MRLILASASPRRAELMAAAGFAFDVRIADVDERVGRDEPAADYVRRLAAEKSLVVSRREAPGDAAGRRATGKGPAAAPDAAIVIGADTAVVVDGRVLGKPRDDADGRAMLEQLAGRSHQVLTGVSVRCGERELDGVESTSVWFAPLSRADVSAYVATGEGRDKAGGYAIQGVASRFIPRIEGSYSNVVGLPVTLVCRLLLEVASPPQGELSLMVHLSRKSL